MPKLGMEPLRRRQLVEAAIEAIHDRGMNGLTMGDIARRAGVSPALAHHYFGSKDELLGATLRHLLADFAVGIRHRLACSGDPRQRLQALIAGSFGPDQFRPAVISAWLAFYMQSLHDPDAARLLSVYLKRLEANLRHDLRALMPAEQAATAARGIAAMIDGLWLRAALPTLHISPEAAVALVADYLDGLIARHGR
jgi:TetR/AcrR family transcriptional repressor of bet genes